MSSSCIFCRIIRSEIPCHKVLETERVIAFMDINPLSAGHVLVIPKQHATMLHELSDDSASELGLSVKKISQAIHSNFNSHYNVLQNNGKLAHQDVDHVHFHVIPKPNSEQGLDIGWKSLPTDHSVFKSQSETLMSFLAK